MDGDLLASWMSLDIRLLGSGRTARSKRANEHRYISLSCNTTAWNGDLPSSYNESNFCHTRETQSLFFTPIPPPSESACEKWHQLVANPCQGPCRGPGLQGWGPQG